MRPDGDVLPYGETGKWLHDLEGPRDAAAGEPVRRLTGDICAVIENPAVVRRQRPGDDREQGRLAGAVWPNQSGNAAGGGAEGRLVDCEQAAEAFGDSLNVQERLSHGRLPVSGRSRGVTERPL